MKTLNHTIYACIILHEMIVEDERDTYGCYFDYSYDNLDENISTIKIFNGPYRNLVTKLQIRSTLCEKQVHRQLQADLVKYNREHFEHENGEI